MKAPNTLGKLIILNGILATAVFIGLPLGAPVPNVPMFGRLSTLLPPATAGSATYGSFPVVLLLWRRRRLLLLLLLLLLQPLSPQGCS